MKILAGEFKGVELAVPESGSTRPTVDHFKKNIFKTIGPNIPQCVWDLFAGCGGVGLEFLSRGSSEVVFVEQKRASVDCLNLNVAECRLKAPDPFASKSISVLLMSVQDFLKSLGSKRYNVPQLIFMDPPYNDPVLFRTLEDLSELGSLKETSILVEHVTEQIDILKTLTENRGLVLESQDVYGPKALSLLRHVH